MAPGTVLAGYRLVEPLGSGGMGEVWRAVNIHLDTMVRAVKVIRREFAADPDFRARFLREARLLHAINHPNVLRVLDVASQDGMLVLSTELLEGIDVEALLARQGQLAAKVATSIGAQAFRGMSQAHAHGIIHRDLKPANLFLQRNGLLKVVDFGIAWEQAGGHTLTGAGCIPGTPAYFAPEFAEGDSASAASDVYAIGITLFQLLAGRPPFLAGSGTPAQVWTGLLLQHATRPLPDLRLIRPDVPEALIEAVEAATDKRPASRPSAAQMAERLSAIAVGHSKNPAVAAAHRPPSPLAVRLAAQRFAMSRAPLGFVAAGILGWALAEFCW